MIISSRTPEGTPNQCPVCGHRCWVVPSLANDAPCPRCGHLLWFSLTTEPAEQCFSEHLVPTDVYFTCHTFLPVPPDFDRPKRPQNPPTPREPHVQAQRLIRRLIQRAKSQLGTPATRIAGELAGIQDPQDAERLLSLLHNARSWADLLAEWRLERGGPRPLLLTTAERWWQSIVSVAQKVFQRDGRSEV